MAEQIPPWLAAMRAITGLTETPGSADNPKIMFMADYIAKKYPEQANYAGYYTGDDVAWCGLTVAFVMAVADVEPVYGPSDTDRWMWAQAWGGEYWEAEEIDEPRLGCVIVMSREGGGHVTLMEQHEDGSFLKDGYYRGRGGNQSDMVNVSNQAKSSVIALMWPKAGGPSRPTIEGPRFERVVISSGHGKYVAGASGVFVEVEEARKVVEQLAIDLRKRGVEVVTFHDDTSKDQSTNLNTIVDFHNKQDRELDVSVHFNAFEDTDKPMGVEVLYYSDEALADEVSAAIAGCGFIDRGPKKRTDLTFLNGTDEPAILIETCFCDSEADAQIYDERFDAICEAIAGVLSGREKELPEPDKAKPKRRKRRQEV